jgi:hypothetical protein
MTPPSAARIFAITPALIPGPRRPHDCRNLARWFLADRVETVYAMLATFDIVEDPGAVPRPSPTVHRACLLPLLAQ